MRLYGPSKIKSKRRDPAVVGVTSSSASIGKSRFTYHMTVFCMPFRLLL